MTNVHDQSQPLNTELLREAKSHDLPAFHELCFASQQLELLSSDLNFSRWSEQSLQLVQYTLYAPDISSAYFTCCARLIDRNRHESLFELIDTVYDLHHRSPLLATAFMRHLPAMLEPADNFGVNRWAHVGLKLCSENWKSIGLGQLFFNQVSTLQSVADKDSIEHLATILGSLAEHSVEISTTCLSQSVSALKLLDRDLHHHFLQLAGHIITANWSEAWNYFEYGPRLIADCKGDNLDNFLELAGDIVRHHRLEPYLVFADIIQTLSQIPAGEHAELNEQARRLNRRHPLAALEFLRSAPRVRTLLPEHGMDAWVESGLRYLSLTPESNENAGELLVAFFRLESVSATQALAELSGRIDFEHTGNLLRLYGQALAGEEVRVQPALLLVNRGLGWTSAQSTTTDGLTIYVPQYMDTFADARSNLQAYKVCVAHQAGRLVFGSFGFQYDMNGSYLPSTVSDRAAHLGRPIPADDPLQRIPIHRFFKLFDDRSLIQGIFSLVEDYRINCQTCGEYPGLVDSITRVKADEIGVRPAPSTLPLRQALVENLMHVSLDSMGTTMWPTALARLMEPALEALCLVTGKEATVQDSAEAAAFIYDIASRVPNIPANELSLTWEQVNRPSSSTTMVLPDTDQLIANLGLDSLTEDVYENPLLANFHGEFKPELVQTLDLLRNNQESDLLTAEQLQELLDQSTEVDGVRAEAIEREIITDEPVEIDGGPLADDTAEASDESIEIEDPEQVLHWYTYDEWNFRANDYLKGWCQLGERRMAEGSDEYYEHTLKQYAGLVTDVRRQFELMRPESQRILKNLDDGHQIDLDKAIEFFIDKKAGVGPRARFYSRRDKIERSVAVAFLLDMSGSTQEPVRPAAARVDGKTITANEELRIIDLEKASTVLIIEALEAIGDSYGIYGFSGDGRSNVSYHIIKDFDQQFDVRVKRRIDKIEPLKSTRMGTAIRHTCSKLADCPAKVKILMLISDGRPQDQGYGDHHGDHDYAIHDTRQALTECKQQGIVPFLITVDKEGQDYLKDICKDMGYEIVSDVEALPKRLTTIYRHLATKS